MVIGVIGSDGNYRKEGVMDGDGKVVEVIGVIRSDGEAWSDGVGDGNDGDYGDDER